MKVYLHAVAVITLLVPAHAMAVGFLNDYAAWKKAPAEFQTVYLQGAVDGWLQLEQNSDPEKLKARRAGMLSCFQKRNFDASLALELVNNHYKAHPVDWQYAPAVVLYFAINSMCLPEINEERGKLGLPALVRLPAQLSKDRP